MHFYPEEAHLDSAQFWLPMVTVSNLILMSDSDSSQKNVPWPLFKIEVPLKSENLSCFEIATFKGFWYIILY